MDIACDAAREREDTSGGTCMFGMVDFVTFFLILRLESVVFGGLWIALWVWIGDQTTWIMGYRTCCNLALYRLFKYSRMWLGFRWSYF